MSACPLRRCQGRRGCLCPKKPGAIGTYGVYQEGEGKSPKKPARQPAAQRSSVPRAKKQVAKVKPKADRKSPTAQPAEPPAPVAAAEAVEAKNDTPTDVNPIADLNVPETPAEPVEGIVILRYNHYRHEVKTTSPPGSVLKSDIDELFSLKYGFKGNYKVHLVSDNNLHDSTRMPETEDSVTSLALDTEYWLSVEEDEEAESAIERKAYKAAGGSNFRVMDNGDDFGGEDKANCSCIEGNPCAVKYNCKDWANRFEVAKKNGWKGF